MTTDKLDLVEPATNEQIKNFRKYIAGGLADHKWTNETILTLIARVEAAEGLRSKLIESLRAAEGSLTAEQELRRDRDEDVAHEFGLRDKAEHDLATAAKLIEAQHEALEAAHLYVVNAGYPALQAQELTKLAFVGSTDLAGHLARTLAAHDDWKKGESCSMGGCEERATVGVRWTGDADDCFQFCAEHDPRKAGES